MNTRHTKSVFSAGMICSLNVGYWSGMKQLRPQDIGLDPEDAPEELVSLGRQRLMPKEALRDFKRLESAGRRILMQNGFPFAKSVSGYFVPTGKIVEVDTALHDLKRYGQQSAKDPIPSFYEIVGEYVSSYPERRNSMLRQWFNQLHRIAAKNSLGAEFIDSALVSLDNYYPSIMEVDGRFRFDWTLLEIVVPGADSTVPNNNPEIAAAIERSRERHQQTIDEFVESVIVHYRDAAAEITEKWCEYLKSGEPLHHQKLSELRNFLTSFREMNFVGDQPLADQLSRLEAMIPESVRDINSNLGGIQDRMAAALQSAKDVASGLTSDSLSEIKNNFFGSDGRAVIE